MGGLSGDCQRTVGHSGTVKGLTGTRGDSQGLAGTVRGRSGDCWRTFRGLFDTQGQTLHCAWLHQSALIIQRYLKDVFHSSWQLFCLTTRPFKHADLMRPLLMPISIHFLERGWYLETGKLTAYWFKRDFSKALKTKYIWMYGMYV